MTDTEQTALAGIRAEAALCLRPGNDEPLVAVPERLRQLVVSLQQLPLPQLVATVEELSVFAMWVGDEKRSPAAKEALLAVAREVMRHIDEQTL